MAVKFHLVQKKDVSRMAQPGDKLFYAQTYATGKCDLDTLCETVADRSTATAGDVKLVIDGLMFVLRQRLLAGEVVQIGELGSFQAIIGSKGSATKAEFSNEMIQTRRILFRPGKVLNDVRKKFFLVQTGSPQIVPDVAPDDEGEEPPGGL